MSDEWTAAPGSGIMPDDLDPTQTIDFRLLDDPETRTDLAGNLWWGDKGDGGVYLYRVAAPAAVPQARPHSHYFKDVAGLSTVDVYRVLELFGVTNPSLAHAIKKLLVAGGRGAGKDIRQDVQEAIDSLLRWQEMRAEDAASRRA